MKLFLVAPTMVRQHRRYWGERVMRTGIPPTKVAVTDGYTCTPPASSSLLRGCQSGTWKQQATGFNAAAVTARRVENYCYGSCTTAVTCAANEAMSSCNCDCQTQVQCTSSVSGKTCACSIYHHIFEEYNVFIPIRAFATCIK